LTLHCQTHCYEKLLVSNSLSLSLLLLQLQLNAQGINPIRMGQFFEQGYGKAQDDWAEEESALDILATPYGLAFCGWINSESVHQMALWQIDSLGRLIDFAQHGTNGGYGQVASALAQSGSGNFLLAGRQTGTFHDSLRHSLQSGDIASFKYLGPTGDLLWEFNTDSLASDTSSVAVDVVYTGAGTFTALINLMWGETPRYAFRLLHIDSTGNTLWQETHELSSTEIFAEKLLSYNGEYIVLVNRLDNPAPMLWYHTSSGTYNTHSTYSQAHDIWGYGLTPTTTGFAIAGKEYDGSRNSGSLLRIAANLSEISHSTHNSSSTGNAWYEDLTAHSTGFLAIGQCDNRGEGQQDVWICYLDSLGDTLKTETLGGEQSDYGHSVVLVPQLYSTFVAGYNSSYGIEESGNAYLGGVKVDMGLLEANESCEIPRILFVDNLISGRNLSSGLIMKDVLNNSTKENDLVKFCDTNNIGMISVYNLGYLFDDYFRTIPGPNYLQYIVDDRNQAKSELVSFIIKCQENGIKVGYIGDQNDSALQEVLRNRIGEFNYKVTGKFNFAQLEHEFWNPTNRTLLNGDNYVSSGLTLDNYFLEVYKDHKTLLGDIQTAKRNDGNIWKSFDYVTYFFNNNSGAAHGCGNTSQRETKVNEITSLVDAVFLAYYQEYNITYEGHDFLLPASSTDPQLQRFRDRLSDFGKQGIDRIIPLFSGEYWRSTDSCGLGREFDNGVPVYEYNYLGKYLDGPPANSSYSGNDFKNLESEYLTQHTSIFNSPPSGFDSIANVRLSGMAWFKYSCLDSKWGFLDKSLNQCVAYSDGILETPQIDEVNHIIAIFPNPSTSKVIVSATYRISRISVFNSMGTAVLQHKVDNESIVELDLSSLPAGNYVVLILNESYIHSGKIVLTK
jgi:hypothetical protein